MRHPYWGYYVDDLGNSIANGNVSVYLAGTTTPAKIYLTETDPTPIETPPQLTTDEHGFFAFWVDEKDYPLTQRFRIILEKEGYQSVDLDNVVIFRGLQLSSLAKSNPSLDNNPLVDINFLNLTPLTEEPEPTIKNKIWFEPYRIRYKDDAGYQYVIATEEWALGIFQLKHIAKVPRDFDSLNDAVGWAYDKGQGIVYVEVTEEPIPVNETVELKPAVMIIGGHGRARPETDTYSKLVANVSPVFKFDYYSYTVDTIEVTRRVTILNVIANLIIDGQGTQATCIEAETLERSIFKNLNITGFTGDVITTTSGKNMVIDDVKIDGGTSGIVVNVDNSVIKGVEISNLTTGISITRYFTKVLNPLIYNCGEGIRVSGNSNVIENPTIIYCNRDGIILDGELNNVIGGEISNNGQEATGYSGVKLTTNAKYCKVRGVNRIGNTDTPYTQSYGVYEESGGDYNEVSGCIFVNNVDEPLIISGINTIYYGNLF